MKYYQITDDPLHKYMKSFLQPQQTATEPVHTTNLKEMPTSPKSRLS